MIRIALIAAIGLLAASMASAADVTAGSLKISAPWARATPKGASVGAGYLTITNTGTAPDRLIGGSSDVSSRFEVHSMTMENGVMKMRPVAGGLEIKPGDTVVLKPDGFHVMFVGLKAPLVEGHPIKVTLMFEKAGKVEVEFPVEAIGAMRGSDDHAMPGMKMNH
jgi:copper(I)-binding protein